MKKRVVLAAAVAVWAIAPKASEATVINFDFTTLNGGAEGVLPSQVTVNGIVATGQTGNGTADAPLWLRNGGDDHGLGVCSEGQSNCTSGHGDVNEISSLTNVEAIYLQNTNGGLWTSLWASSLDSGGSNGHESGQLLWTSVATASHPHGDFTDPSAGSFTFQFGDFGADVEADILQLALLAGFDPSAQFLEFRDNPANCETVSYKVGWKTKYKLVCNNDYLVWKGSVDVPDDVPEPFTISLLGVGLLGIAAKKRLARVA